MSLDVHNPNNNEVHREYKFTKHYGYIDILLKYENIYYIIEIKVVGPKYLM